MFIEMIEYPKENDWQEVKRRTLVTIGKKSLTPPTKEWETRLLRARHSPIRYLRFSFYLENIPYWVSVHLCRHVHSVPYCKSQRNDRQADYDRNSAPQDAPISMIWDMNAEELMTIASKRLCNQAAKETREVVRQMCMLVEEKCPEFIGLLVPPCVRYGKCEEFKPCGNPPLELAKQKHTIVSNAAIEKCNNCHFYKADIERCSWYDTKKKPSGFCDMFAKREENKDAAN